MGDVDYTFDVSRKQAFCAAIRRYYPGLAEAHLIPGYTGIRAKLVDAGGPAQDFTLSDSRSHGVAGLVQLFGIESPGLTASLALAELVLERLHAQ